jgi:SAM-dependent methyltransferase
VDQGAAIADVLSALVDGDTDRARTAADKAAAAGGSPLAGALAAYLSAATGTASVYTEPTAFEAFIHGGGNVGLYRAVSAALAERYDLLRPASLLDIGCGDGNALAPALAIADHRPDSLTLVEPSAALLDAAVRRLAGTARTWSGTAQSFAADLPAGSSFDLVESTFALHAIPHPERTDLLTALRPHTRRLAIVEFDVPDHSGAERLRFLARTYERGLAEYGTDRDLVARGFLMPVLVGQLAPGAPRSTWEQPASAWSAQVEAAGYTDTTVTPLYDYWSSPAFLLTARGAAR